MNFTSPNNLEWVRCWNGSSLILGIGRLNKSTARIGTVGKKKVNGQGRTPKIEDDSLHGKASTAHYLTVGTVGNRSWGSQA